LHRFQRSFNVRRTEVREQLMHRIDLIVSLSLFTQPAASSKPNPMNFDFFIGKPPPRV
jgi:hypothetical protein